MLPRASFSVVTPPDSSRALFSIVAAASELEKEWGRMERCLGLCEKNNGDGGAPSGPTGADVWKVSRSSVGRGLSFGRFLFEDGSVSTGLPFSSVLACFETCVVESGLEIRSGF